MINLVNNAVVQTLVVLGFMVLVHEFGHFITAKLFKVRRNKTSCGADRAAQSKVST